MPRVGRGTRRADAGTTLGALGLECDVEKAAQVRADWSLHGSCWFLLRTEVEAMRSREGRAGHCAVM